MRPRVRIALAIGGLVVVGTVATLAGRQGRREPEVDPRRSTYLDGPQGASGYARALAQLGVEVERFRDRPARLSELGRGPMPLLAVLSPSDAISSLEAEELVAFSRSTGDLLLAGPSAEAAIRCFGFAVEYNRRDSVFAVPPGSPVSAGAPPTHAVLVPQPDTLVADTVEAASGIVATCRVPVPLATDTLLAAPDGRPVAVRLTVDSLTDVTLVADGSLFSNRRLRSTDAGVFALRLVVGRYQRVVFDEYHHGYARSGNLTATLLAWSAESPWGWAVWHLLAVGVLALLAAGIRFGPPRQVVDRRRRSPLEHVRALATVLAAAKGHDVAIRLLVRGLRRRLSYVGSPVRGDPGSWLAGLHEHVRTPRGREAVITLERLTRDPQPAGRAADRVLRAANAVEDVWEDLRP